MLNVVLRTLKGLYTPWLDCTGVCGGTI